MVCVKYIEQPDDNEATSLRVPRRVRRKLGFLVNSNDHLSYGLEKILDAELEKIPERI